MAMENYKLESDDGSFVYRQFDDGDEQAKVQLEALREAVKDKNHPLKSVTKGNPKPAEVT
jgi:hypothetical protein